MVKAQSNKVSCLITHLFEKVFLPKFVHLWTLLLPLKAGGGASSNASAPAKTDGPSAEGKDKNSLKDDSSSSSSSPNLATEESISEFLTQVTTLVK